MVAPVRVRLAGSPPSQPVQVVHTLDATETGVRLAGLRGELKAGDVIEVQYRHGRAMFRVVWVHVLSPSEMHVGAECVERDKNIWGADFPDLADEYEVKE